MRLDYISSWRPEAEKFYKGVDPQKIAEEVFSLGDNPQTEEILEMAKDETKEFHKLIEWDDKKAAGKYRLTQVRKVMGDLQIVDIGLNAKKRTAKIGIPFQPLRLYYNLEGESGYRSIPTIIQSEDLHKKLLLTAKSELYAFMAKYSILTELEPVFKAIRDLDKPNPAA